MVICLSPFQGVIALATLNMQLSWVGQQLCAAQGRLVWFMSVSFVVVMSSVLIVACMVVLALCVVMRRQ